MKTETTYIKTLGKVEAKLSRMKEQAAAVRWFYENGNLPESYNRALRLEELSEQAVLLTRVLPAYTGAAGATAQTDAIISDTIPVEIGFTAEGWFSIRIPALLPKKASGSADYIRSYLYPAMRKFFEGKPPIRFRDCVLAYRHVYDRSRPERAMRDHDNIETNMVIGKVLTIDELMNDYGFEAVYVASGAGLPRFMGIPGESLNGVYSANEYLTRVNLMKAYRPDSRTPIMQSKSVAVVGGGNVAMDAARCAKRLGAENVYIVYRRGMAELPARKEEVEHAEEEGIIFKTLTNPTEVLGDENGWVKGMTCVEMELGEPDASGRRRPIVKEGSEFVLDVDTMIMALGTSPNPLIRSTTPGLDADKHGCLITNGPDGLTSRPMVYAGGDAVTGAATVILAMGAGKEAARAIDAAIMGKEK